MRSGLGSTDVHFGITPRADSAPAWLKRLEESHQSGEKEPQPAVNEQRWFLGTGSRWVALFKACVLDFACRLRGSHPAPLRQRQTMTPVFGPRHPNAPRLRLLHRG